MLSCLLVAKLSACGSSAGTPLLQVRVPASTLWDLEVPLLCYCSATRMLLCLLLAGTLHCVSCFLCELGWPLLLQPLDASSTPLESIMNTWQDTVMLAIGQHLRLRELNWSLLFYV